MPSQNLPYNEQRAARAPASTLIRPFRVNVEDADLADLRRRINITDVMAMQAPPELLGMHTNMPGVVPAEVSKAIQTGGPAPSGMSEEERGAYEKLKTFFAKNAYYAFEMATRPQTLYGISDSPIGLAAWLIDHGDGDAQPAAALVAAARRPRGRQSHEELSRDDVLDNITLYWLTNTAVSSSRLYWENKLPFFDAKSVTICGIPDATR